MGFKIKIKEDKKGCQFPLLRGGGGCGYELTTPSNRTAIARHLAMRGIAQVL